MRLLVKLGGTLLESEQRRASLASQLKLLLDDGNRVVVVHGGGKRLSRYLAGLDHKSEFRSGLRVTPPEILDAVLRVLAGSVNRQLVAELQREGLNAVGTDRHRCRDGHGVAAGPGTRLGGEGRAS